MKVLFLDIDGVVNSKQTLVKQYQRTGKASVLGIDPHLAFKVGKIILDTDCKVVLSSSWRNHPDGVAEVKARVYPELYGTTPNLNDGFRGAEVRAWLDEHPEVTEYAILDDDSDFYDYQPLFQTSWEQGITDYIAERVTKHLNGEAFVG